MTNIKRGCSDICAIVPAAGLGRRMQMKRPKQYLFVSGKTILEHSVSLLLEHPRVIQVVVIIHPRDTYFSTLPLARHPKIVVANGGKKRENSVFSGMQMIKDVEWILIHDAVRPCLHQDDLARLLEISYTSQVGGVLAIPVRDTIKRAKPGKTAIDTTIDRTDLWHALTPQFFPRKLLYNCLTQVLQKGITISDEAAALEHFGFHPELIEGRSDNIKITRKKDLQFAEFYLTYAPF